MHQKYTQGIYDCWVHMQGLMEKLYKFSYEEHIQFQTSIEIALKKAREQAPAPAEIIEASERFFLELFKLSFSCSEDLKLRQKNVS